MLFLGMKGPYRLDTATIDAKVTHKSPGNYILGRRNQMIKFKGTTLYPPVLYDILNDFEEVENYVVEVSKNTIDTDELRVIIGSHQYSKDFEKVIKDHFRAKLRVAPRISFLNPEEVRKLQFGHGGRKPATFIDLR